MSKVEKLDVLRDFTEEEERVFLPNIDAGSQLDEDIASSYQRGVGIKELTTFYGVSVGRVYDALNRKGVKLRKGMYNSKAGNRLMTMTTSEKDRLVEDYLSGMAMLEIYKKHNINKHGCYTLLSERKVALRGSKSKQEDEKDQEVTLFTVDTETSIPTDELTSVQAQLEGDTLHIRITILDGKPIDKINATIDLKGAH